MQHDLGLARTASARRRRRLERISSATLACVVLGIVAFALIPGRGLVAMAWPAAAPFLGFSS
jgi:hypothetical protein